MQFEILIDHSETSNKCTILPLHYRDDFSIRHIRKGRPLTPPHTQVLLHHEGVPLQEWVKNHATVTAIGAIDCIWRRLDPILACLEGGIPDQVCIPPGFVTAYPRRSREYIDPDGGLATIEALFIAAAFCGHWDESLFEQYYFGVDFLEQNREAFRDYGILVPEIVRRRPDKFNRTSEERRRARGRFNEA